MFGIIFALGAASSWTYACYLWRKQTKYLSASQINITKNIIAFLIFSPVILTLDFQHNLQEILILLLSGIIGISIGDTFYIMSLKKLGTRRTLTVEAFSPVIATLLGSILLHEILSLKSWVGTMIVTFSLIGVALDKTVEYKLGTVEKEKKLGFIFAFLSVLCAVSAATLSRLVLINSDLRPFQSTEIRLFGSIISLLPFMRNDLINSITELSFERKIRLVFATFLGTNIGILFQQYVFKLLPIGLGWTLLSTSPIISLFFARAEGEDFDWKTLALTITTILGVALVLI